MKKAQIQLFETIGVLVVFFFLLIAGAVFYFKMQEISIQNDLAQQAHLRSLQATQRAMFLPELDCSFIGVPRENCFDVLKLKAFSKVMQDPHVLQTYFGLFGYASINVSEAYPDKPFVGWMYNNPLDEYRSALKSLSPVLLYDPVANQYAFGVMEVVTYSTH